MDASENLQKLTPKMMKFAHSYIEMGNASDAYVMAYDAMNMSYSSIKSKAGALLAHPKVSVYIRSLKEEHRVAHNVTVESLINELEEARIIALNSEKPQPSAAVSATMGKAKLCGLDKQVIDHTSSDGSMRSLTVTFTDGNQSTE